MLRDVDFQEDLEFIKEIYKRLYKYGKFVITKEVICLLTNTQGC